MSSSLRMLQSARHRLSPWRVIGAGTWLIVAFWSSVLVLLLASVQDPTFIGSLGAIDGLGGLVTLVRDAVSLSTTFLVVFLVTLVVVPLRFVRELRRAVHTGRTDLARRLSMAENGSDVDVLLGARPPGQSESSEERLFDQD